MSIHDDKAELRRRMRGVRRAMGEAEVVVASGRIVERLMGCAWAAEARSWFVYVSVGHEVGTRGLIERLLGEGRTVCVPRTVPGSKGVMEAVEIGGLGELVVGGMNIPEPLPGALNRKRYDGAVDVCVVPGVAFTVRGERLGGGLGFYDRWLGTGRYGMAVGLAFSWQVVDVLPVEPHDVRLDAVVTEMDVYVAGRSRI